MSYPTCSACERAFRSVRWIDTRTGDLASGRALRAGHARRLCIDCQIDVGGRERASEVLSA
jgi:hypothetical protein